MSDHDPPRLRSVNVPDHFRETFLRAQEQVRRYFENRVDDPRHGTISISGERYILVRAASLSTEFFDLVASLHRNLSEVEAHRMAAAFLFDLSHAIGKADARHFHEKMRVSDPVEKLSAGPVHFSHSGWAFVDILPESSPSPDEDYYLVYDHPHSFEADAWLKKGKRAPSPACIMNAGYSSGWCEESFGVVLVAVELQCRAMGHERCRFVMAPPGRIEAHISGHPVLPADEPIESPVVDIPGFFQSKHLKKELQRERDFSTAILDTVGALVVVLEPDGRIITYNRACKTATACAIEDAAGRRFWELFPDEDGARRARAAFEQVGAGRHPVRFEGHWATETGERCLIEWSLNALRDASGAVENVVCAGSDITERNRLEQDLARQVHRLSEVNAELDAFAYSVSHDLRTPLRDMEGFAQALLDNHVGTLTPDGHEFARRIVRSARDMDALIRDLLQYSRLSHAEIRVEAVDLEAVVRDVLLKLDGLVRPRAAEVTVERPLSTVTGHRTTLLQVMENLVSNAIKFVDAGRTPQVRIHTTEEGGRVRLWVEDNGIGIAPGDQERIFRPLERLHGVDAFPGTGIGLALVDKGLRRMGGRVGVTSAEGQGSRFWVELPLGRPGA